MTVTNPASNSAAILDQNQRQQVASLTRQYVDRAEQLFDVVIGDVDISFDLRGRCAGMFRCRNRATEIRYNPWIFARYFEQNLAETVPHEVAHYVVYRLFPRRQVKPHGNEWRKVMLAFDVEPRVTCDFDLSGLPQRRLQRHAYACDCRSHSLTSIRHNRIVSGKRRYHCRACGQTIQQTQ